MLATISSSMTSARGAEVMYPNATAPSLLEQPLYQRLRASDNVVFGNERAESR